MSKKLLFRLAVLLTAMMCALGANAAEAYACYTPSNTTLTFYYDNSRSSRTGTTYDLNEGNDEPGWMLDGTCLSVTHVVFDPSFQIANPSSTSYWFCMMDFLESITDIFYLDTSNVQYMESMFSDCNLLTSLDLRSFDTSNVTDMDYMFSDCSGLTNLDLSNFKTSKVRQMTSMFQRCSNLTTLEVGDNWYISSATSTTNMFQGCTQIRGEKGTTYNASHVDGGYAHIDGGSSNPGYLTRGKEAYACYTSSNSTLTFYYDKLKNSRSGLIHSLDYELLTDVPYPVPEWRYDYITSVVFNSSFADFYPQCTAFWFIEHPELLSITGLNYLNTSHVMNMEYMFAYCSGLTSLDVSGFNTFNVIEMDEMFAYCSGLTSLDVSGFNTSNVNRMAGMFNNCTGLTSLDLCSFNTANVRNMEHMFNDCTNLRTIYAGNGWSTTAVTSSTNMFNNCTRLVGGQGTTYSSSHTDKAYARIDGGPSNPGYLTEKEPEAYACYTPSNSTLTFYYDNQRYIRPGDNYDLNSGTLIPDWLPTTIDVGCKYVIFDQSFANYRPTSTFAWFTNMDQLEVIAGIENLNTSSVTHMNNMFDGCSSLTNLDVSGFNTSNVTNMSDMFYGCSGLTNLDVSGLNTSNVTNMTNMFSGCTGLTSLDVSGFNTSMVTEMQYMFYGCTGLTSLDVSGFNTANVTNMRGMFAFCSKLKSLDLSSFNTANVVAMRFMFYNCGELQAIYAGDGWSTDAVTISDNMFTECTSLVGGQGTTYSSSNPTDKTYAHIDGGPSNPGYLTDPDVKLAYACYTPSNTTLTFYYDNQRYTRPGTTYNLNTGSNAPGWRTDNTYLNVTKVVFNSSFSGARPTSTYRWFDGMTNLTSITVIPNFHTSEVTNMASMFRSCKKLTSLDLSNFNTANVTNMQYMFNECTNLTTITVGRNWSTAAVTSSADMFLGCTSLVGEMGTSYDASHVNKAYAHIDGGSSNPGYLTGQTNMYACYTPSNTTLSFYCDGQWSNRPGTIYYVSTGSGNVSPSWQSAGISTSVTRVVIDPSMAGKSVPSAYRWFANMSNLVSITGLNYLDMRMTTSLSYMFQGCSSLTSLDLSNFITSQVSDMRYMFEGCSNLVTVYVGGGWSTASTTTSNSVNMFRGCVKIRGEKGTTYSSGHTNKLYAHIDGGSSNPGYFTTGSEAYACYTPSNTTLTFYYDRQRSSRSGTTYDLNTGSNNPGWYSVRASVTKVVFNSSFAEAHPTTTYGWFREMTNVTSMSGLNYLNTSWAVNMSYMFYRCSQLTSLDLSGFNTANVINMTSMFNGCNRLTSLDVSSFNTAQVTNMTSMFYGCSQLTSLDVSSFNTSNVTNMTSMFRNCTGLVTIYAGSEWSTVAVTSSGNMFTGSSSLVGGRGTTYDANHVDAAYAHIDGGTSNPGYFTAKNASQRGDVNADGHVNITDVTALINYLLTDNASNINLTSADANQDSNINISDVTALINYLLSGTWPNKVTVMKAKQLTIKKKDSHPVTCLT